MAVKSPLLLAGESTETSAPAIDFVNSRSMKNGYVLGGSSLVTQTVLDQMTGE